MKSLNHIYSVVWNASLGLWQVVSEVVRRGGKTQSEQRKNRKLDGKLKAAASLLLVGMASPGLVLAQQPSTQLPTGGQVVGGQASIVQSGNALNITQGTDRAAIDWQTFNVGQGNSINFQQPSASSIALNRVLGSDVSVIQGAINANGQVFLVNQNGILFTPTAQVNVGGIVASTQNISTADFMAGKYTFSGSSTSTVENQGSITTTQGGTVALIAAKIINTGTITAPQGTVGLAAGNTVTLDLGGPVKIQVTEGALNTLIEQHGGIVADGGRIYLTAKAAGELAASAINHTGITRARTLAQGQTGEIILIADMSVGTTTVAGTLDASAPDGGNGGFIETSAAKVKIHDGVNITAYAAQGKNGEFLIDPIDFTIAATGGDLTGSQLGSILNVVGLTIQTDAQQPCVTAPTCGPGKEGNGDIFVNDNVTWNSPAKLTLRAHRNILINKTITSTHANGSLALEYGQGAVAQGNTAQFSFGLAPEGFAGRANLHAGDNFSTKLGSDGQTIVYKVITQLGAEGSTTGTDLQGMNANLAGNFALGADIDASATAQWNNGAGFDGIGSGNTSFNGRFTGLGHSINTLTVKRPTEDFIGLFDFVDKGTLRDVGVVNATIESSSTAGALVGLANNAAISQAYSSGTVKATNTNAGGLIGDLQGGLLKHAFSNSSVTGGSSLGGLIGNAQPAANQLQISEVFATGSVSGSESIGGLIGFLISNSGQVSLTDAYATGNVSASQFNAGGLIGSVQSRDKVVIDNTYAVGQVTIPVANKDFAGGLIGSVSISNQPGSNAASAQLTDSFFDTNTTGQSQAVGFIAGGSITVPMGSNVAAGKTTADMQKLATFNGAGWNISGSDGTYPTLTFRSGKVWKIGPDSTPIFIRLDCGLCESIYGETPQFSFKAFNMASGGTEIGDAALAGNAVYSLTSGGMAAGTVLGRLTDAGTYAVTYTSGLTGNSIYSLSAGAATSFTIKPKLLTVAIQAALGSPLSKVYDGNDTFTLKAENFAITGFVDQQGTGARINQTAATFNNSNVAQANLLTTTVGSGNLVVADGVKASNYSLPSTTLTAAGTIKPKALAITTNDFVSSPLATATIANTTGLVSNQSVSAVNVSGKNVSVAFGENTLASNYATTLVVPGASGADLNVNRDLTLAEGLNLTMRADKNININSVIDATAGTGGKVTLEYGQGAVAASNTAQYILKLTNDGFTGKVNLKAGQNFGTKLGSDGSATDFTVITELGAPGSFTRTDLQGINGGVSGNYVVGADIDASATSTQAWIRSGGASGFTPIFTPGRRGVPAAPFSGTFDGLGHTVNNLTITIPNNGTVGFGLFGLSTGHIRHVGLLGGNVNAGLEVGALVGRQTGGSIRHVYSTANVSGAQGVGGLIGNLTGGGSVRHASASGMVSAAVSGVNSSSAFGGLIGRVDENSTVANSRATGNVQAPGSSIVGGLVGITNNTIINDVYATGAVAGLQFTGGLVGLLSNSSLSRAYASGAVTGPTTPTPRIDEVIGEVGFGGLVGVSTSSTLTDVFATGNVNAGALRQVGGLVGGLTGGSLTNGYATGMVMGAQDVGGLIGAVGGSPTLSNSFWNTQTTGRDNAVGSGELNVNSGGNAGKTTTQLQNPFTFIDAGWNFETVWGKSIAGANNANMQLRSFSNDNFDDYVRVANATKVYGSANSTATGAAVSGVGAANVSASLGSAISELSDAGEYLYSTDNVLTVTNKVSGRNTFVDRSGKLVITPKALTMALQGSTANPLSKVYDGNTTLALGSGNFALSGFVGQQGTGALLNGVTSGTFNNANVLQANTVSVNVGEGTLVLAEGAKASNYSLPTTAITAAGTITAKALTITGTTVADKTYDGNTAATVTVGKLNGLLKGETLGATTATGTFASKDVVRDAQGNLVVQDVQVAYTLADGVAQGDVPAAKASNYTLAAETKTAKINPKALTITGTTVANKTYDGNQTASVTAGTLSGLVEGETLGTTTATGTFADKNAGKGKNVAVAYTLANGTNEAHKAGNYSLAGETKQADIAQKQITVTDFAAANKTYDGNRTATITNTGKLNGVIEADTAKVALGNTGAMFDTKNAGTGKTVTLNGTSLSGDEAKNYVLANEAVTAKADIAKRDITVSGIAASDKTYDGNTNATISNAGTLNNVVQGETLTVSTVGKFDNKDAGDRNVNTTTFIGNGNDEISLAGNYNLTNATGSVKAKINQKALTIAGTVVSSKTYDGNTIASVTVGTLSGFVAGENPGSVTGAGTFASKDVARDSNGNVIAQNVEVAYTLADGQTQVREVACRPECGPGEATPGSGGRTKLVTVEGAKASNYTLAAETKTATLNTKALTVNGTTVDNKTYDGNRNATVKIGTLSGLIDGETLGTTTATGNFADKDAGQNKNVAVAYTLSNGSNAAHKASNYSVAEQTLQATINQRALTIAGTTVADKTYDGNTAATITVGTLNGLLKGETLGTTTATGTFASKDVVRDAQGNALAQDVQVAYTLADGVAQGDVPAAKASNYSLAAETKTAKINPKALSITGTTVANKTYDGNQTASVTVGTLSGLVEGETLGTTTATGTFADKNAGKGKNVAVAYTLADGVGTTTAGAPIFGPGGNVIGSVPIVVAGAKAGNYSLAGETKQADIVQKQITVTDFAAANKTYDGNRTATITNTGKLNGVIEADTAKVALGNTGAMFDTKNAGTGKTVTLNGTSLSGDEAKNYVLANEAVTAKADIAKKDISLIGFDAASKVYDGNITAQIVNAGALSGVVQDDKVIVSNKGATFDNKDVGSAKTVTLNGVTISGDDAGNYNIAGTATDTANITQKQITVTDFAAANKTYDGNRTATIINTGKLNGVIEADTAKVALGNTGATFDTKNAGTAKTVTLNGTSLSGDEAKNYLLANEAVTAKADIAKRDITVSGIAASDKIYDGNTNATISNAGTFNNVVQGETLTVSTVGTFDSKDAGERKVNTTTTIGNGANDGGLASNYNLTNAGNTVNAKINQKALTIAGTTVANKTYDGNQTASVTVGILNGLVVGETLGTTTATGTFADRKAGKGKNVAVAYTLSNGSNETHLASNYSLAGETKQADIEQKRIALAGFDAADKVYDGTNVAQIVSAGRLTGVIGDDTVSVSNSGATFDNKNAGTEKTVTLNGVTIAGKDAGNYSIADTATDTADIAKRDGVVISADAQSKVVGSADPRLTFVVTGLLEGDAIQGSLVRQPGEAAGLYAITQGSADNSNYNIQFNSADLTITQPVADVAIANANRIATPELQPSLGERREPVPEQSNTAQSLFVTPDQARATGPAQVLVVDGGIRLPGVGNEEQN